MVEATGFEPTTLWSRTIRATSCATPRFFSFLSIFVSGQTCGQATYFERFVEKYTARIVRFFKGFRGSKKSTKESPCGCPERNALPTALRLDLAFFVSGQTCGQITYFGIFSLSCTGKIVRFFKAFSDLQNLQILFGGSLPNATRYQLRYASFHLKRIHYNKYNMKSQIIFPFIKKYF